MTQIPATPINEQRDMGANEVLIGGQNTSDPRFQYYKAYSGCISSKCMQFKFLLFNTANVT